jgi:hypothetical protein
MASSGTVSLEAAFDVVDAQTYALWNVTNDFNDCVVVILVGIRTVVELNHTSRNAAEKYGPRFIVVTHVYVPLRFAPKIKSVEFDAY